MDADVAQAIANKVEVTMSGEEHRRLAAVRYVLPEVYENYLKGKYALAKGNNKANIEESITYFNQAIRKDPTFAPGYSGLARAYWDLGSVFMGGVAEQERPRAVVAAQKALELDPERDETRDRLSDVLVRTGQCEEALRLLRPICRRWPNSPGLQVRLARCLFLMLREDEAREVLAGQECGMSFANYQDIQPGDIIECYEVETVKRAL